MSSNRLRLNPTKTQFIWFGTRQQLAKIDLGLLATKYLHFTFSPSVRDLGVSLNQAAASIWFEIWGLVDPGQKISIL